MFNLSEAQKDVDPPDHDIERLCEIAELLARAMHEDLVIKLRYWKNKRHIDVIGMVKRIDPIIKAVLISVDEDDKRWVEATKIVDVEVL